MRRISLLFFVSMAITPLPALACDFSDTEFLTHVSSSGCTKEVGDYLHREDSCKHFAGELTGGDNKQRDAEVNEAINELHCGELECKRKALLAKYKDDRATLGLINKALHEIYGEDFFPLSQSMHCPGE